MSSHGMRGSLEAFADRVYIDNACGHDIFEHYSGGCTVSILCPSSVCLEEHGAHAAHPNGKPDLSAPTVCPCKVSLHVSYF